MGKEEFVKEITNIDDKVLLKYLFKSYKKEKCKQKAL